MMTKLERVARAICAELKANAGRVSVGLEAELDDVLMSLPVPAPRAKCRWCGNLVRTRLDGELYQGWCDAPNHPDAGKTDHFCGHEREPAQSAPIESQDGAR